MHALPNLHWILSQPIIIDISMRTTCKIVFFLALLSFLFTYTQCTEHEDIENWTKEDIQNWLDANNLSEYKKSFEEHKIDGQAFIKLNLKLLEEVLGVRPLGDRIKITNFIRKHYPSV